MKVRPITSIDTALRLYYQYPELGNAQIKELFGKIGSDTISKYKKAVQAVQAERHVLTSQMFTVNTEIAYEVWGIDVADLKRRRNELLGLGLKPTPSPSL